MNKNDLMKKIKTQLKALVSIKLGEFKSGDLTIYSEDEVLKEGSIVTDAEGAALLTGEYLLDSGEILTVLDGVVTSITSAELTEEVKEEEKLTEEVEEEEAPVEAEDKEKLTDERLSKLEEKVEELLKRLEKEEDEKEELKKELSAVKSQPADKGITSKAVEVGKDKGSVSIEGIRERLKTKR
jgi:flagellar motility protein MotE (MotC chaperone)